MAGINYQLRLVVVITMLKLLLLLLQAWGSIACWQEDRAALLQLKASFNYTSTGEYYGMFTWRRDVDCCKWSGVGCNATTGRVYELRLGGFGSGDWYFNASMFLPFQELRRLSLPGNSIVCCVENGDFERLSNTIDLEYLDLSDNQLGNSILPFVAGFSSLKSLYISDTALSGTSGFEELQKLNSLEILDLSNNDLNNSTLPLLNGLHSLKILHMSNTQQKGSINMKDLVALFKLEELYIGGNNIEKFVVSKDVEDISNISVLWIENNICIGCNFELESLKGFPNVKSLNLENNILTGELFPRELDNVKELFLDYSSFDENFLQSLAALRFLRTVNMQSIHANSPALRSLSNFNTLLQVIENMTSLETLSLRGCKLTGSIHGTRGLCELINLRELDLYDNNLTGNLPHCLVNLTLLQHLDLTNNHFTEKISQSPLKFLTSITYLALRNNQFEIPTSLSPFFNLSKFKDFDAYGNEVYTEIGVVTHNLKPKFQLDCLIFKSTSGGGSFPEFLYHQHSLQLLNISGIPMIGLGFPGWLLENNTKLGTLYLSNCSLSGALRLPERNPNTTLRILDISTNRFYGHIPTEIGKYLPRLQWLELSENEFVGSIPESLSNCSQLELFSVHGNKLFDNVPKWIERMDSLMLLDLSKNNFFGSLPAILGTPNLQHILLSENRLEGPFPGSIYDFHNLQSLDLSHNYLTSVIPKWIGKFYKLRYLLLSYNNFVGEIPVDIWKMTNQLRLADLSHNKLWTLSSNDSYERKNRKSFDSIFSNEGVFEFIVKGNSLIYKIERIAGIGFVGLDLSCNNLTGVIPFEIGNIQDIILLNLSHNSLTGPIPFSFSNMTKIETLDLSYNNLSGAIPSQLTELNFLEVFNVSYNNLSGKTPNMVTQFATFDESSYKGNPFLCGLPLPKSCSPEESATPSSITKESSNDDDSFIDKNTFYISFSVTFTIILVTMFAVLYINPYWRQAWFYFIEKTINSCYYFFVDNFSFLSKL